MNTTIEKFLTNHFGPEAFDSLQLLAESGSARKYYRFQQANQSLILTESDNIEENKTFLYFTEHFSKVVAHLPKVILVSDDAGLYVQTDLGTVSLMQVLENNREESKEIFIKATKQLAKMQILGDANLDYSQCFSYPKFNYLLVLRDLFSFKNYFLNLLGIEFNHGKLLSDFEKFAQDFEQIEYQYFVYRDFQSRNILVQNGEPYFIDYQGGMKGPSVYDLVSLIWQAKANLPQAWKDELYEVYVKEFIELTQQDLNAQKFRNSYELCLIERLLQVLGTYGFRGIYERKAHFLASIEFALKNLDEIKDLALLNRYPELKKVITQLAQPELINHLKQKIDAR